MSMRRLAMLLLFPLISLLSGCTGAHYQPLGVTGGYQDTRLDGNTVRVTYYGNAAMSQETVQNYLLYRCAQVTLSYGYDYFIIIGGGTRAQTSAVNTPGTMTLYNSKGNSYGYYIPGQTIYTSRDISSSMIKMFKGTKPSGMVNAFNARDILKYLTPSVKTTDE